MLGFVWIVAVIIGIWIYDWRRQERLMGEAQIRAAVDEAIAMWLWGEKLKLPTTFLVSTFSLSN